MTYKIEYSLHACQTQHTHTHTHTHKASLVVQMVKDVGDTGLVPELGRYPG